MMNVINHMSVSSMGAANRQSRLVSWNQRFGSHTSLFRRSGVIKVVGSGQNLRQSSHFSPTHT